MQPDAANATSAAEMNAAFFSIFGPSPVTCCQR